MITLNEKEIDLVSGAGCKYEGKDYEPGSIKDTGNGLQECARGWWGYYWKDFVPPC